MGRPFVARNRLKLLSRIEPTCTWLEDNGQYVVGNSWVSVVDKMVGENKSKKGKENGLSCGINRNSTHEYGKEQQHNNQGNMNSELKVKEERKEKESNI